MINEMSFTALTPDIYVPTFQIKVGGTALDPETAKRIQSITVNQRSGSPDHFSLHVHDPGLKLINASGGRLVEGQDVEISIGYVGKEQLTRLIQGKISSLTADFPSSGPAMLTVDGFDRSHDLTRGTAHKSSAGSDPGTASPDSQAVPDIAANYGLRSSVDATETRTKPRVQAVQRSGDRAAPVDDGTLHFKRERPAPNTILLEWGKTLTSFSPRVTTAGQVKNVFVRGWDPNQKEAIVGKAERNDQSKLSTVGQQDLAKGSGGNSELVITNAPVSSQKEADRLAEAIMQNMKSTVTSGSGSCVGLPSMQVGSIINVKGTGRFDGAYTVAEVTHTISESGYQTSFEVNNAPSLAGLSPKSLGPGESMHGPGTGAAAGPIIGIVMENQDTEKLGRVKVRFPRLSPDDVGHWARVATLMAGPERGTFFLPQVDDEVLVAFEHGDVTRPYILGALWNGKDKPPETSADIKLIKSTSGHIIRLDDTSGSEKIEIIDNSGNNSIVIDTNGKTITIKSAQDISIEAAEGTIKLSAKNISLSSTADTKIEAKGGLTVESSGTTTIKGSTVNIN